MVETTTTATTSAWLEARIEAINICLSTSQVVRWINGSKARRRKCCEKEREKKREHTRFGVYGGKNVLIQHFDFHCMIGQTVFFCLRYVGYHGHERSAWLGSVVYEWVWLCECVCGWFGWLDLRFQPIHGVFFLVDNVCICSRPNSSFAFKYVYILNRVVDRIWITNSLDKLHIGLCLPLFAWKMKWKWTNEHFRNTSKQKKKSKKKYSIRSIRFDSNGSAVFPFDCGC